ncbi:MAG: nitroreductase family protein [Acutalibacteraceae bacterium]
MAVRNHACNQESGLHIQLVTNEPKAFDSFMAHYGKFKGVTNYLALIGKKNPL